MAGKRLRIRPADRDERLHRYAELRDQGVLLAQQHRPGLPDQALCVRGHGQIPVPARILRHEERSGSGRLPRSAGADGCDALAWTHPDGLERPALTGLV